MIINTFTIFLFLMLGTFNGGQLLYFLTLYLPQPEICTPSDVAYFNRIKGTVAKLVHQETHLELLSQLLYTLSVSEKVQVRIYLQIIKDFMQIILLKHGYPPYIIQTQSLLPKTSQMRISSSQIPSKKLLLIKIFST